MISQGKIYKGNRKYPASWLNKDAKMKDILAVFQILLQMYKTLAG